MSEVKVIAHRGNVYGPNKDRENSPNYLLEAIDLGFDVEVDVWVSEDKIYLGHDGPEYFVTLDFLSSIKNRAWYHCKNLEALILLQSTSDKYKYFYHESDKYTLTSTGHVWTYPGEKYFINSIVVDLNKNYFYELNSLYAICVDYAVNSGQ
jgi:glycerophosphoryl diester phosphodiesterase